MNERTHFFIRVSLSHLILKRVGVGCVWEVRWRRGQTATFWPKVLLTIAALFPHFGWAAQPWVTEDPSPPSGAGSNSGILSPTDSNCNWNSNWVPSVSWLYFCLTPTCFLWAYASATITWFNHVHRSRWYSDIFDWMHLFRCSSAYLHKYISWLTARLRVNILQQRSPIQITVIL